VSCYDKDMFLAGPVCSVRKVSPDMRSISRCEGHCRSRESAPI
jgi:hypothetical protein